MLVRPTTDRSNLEGRPCEFALGDLRDPRALREAVEGCRVVYHAAADYRLWTRQPDELYECNVQGTENLLVACRQAGVERIVYTSSVAAIGIPRDGSPGNEETPVSLERMIGHYKRSKFLAQQVALRHAAQGLDVVIVNPSTPVGPGDSKPTATGQIITDFLNGRMPAFVDTGLNLVAVEDVAEGHLLAEARGKAGRLYILGNQNMTLKQILDLLADITGLPSPSIRIPSAVAMAIGFVDTAITGGLLRRHPRVPVEGVKMSRKRMWFDSSRAEAELGFRPTGVRDALVRAVTWFVEHGYAPAPARVS